MMMRSLLVVVFTHLFVAAVHSGPPEVKIPLLKKALWQRPLNLDKDLEEDSEKAAKAQVERALDKLGIVPLVPGFFPRVSGNIVLYRTYFDVRAIFLRDLKENGKLIDKAGDIFHKSTPLDGSLANILSHKDLRPTMENWLNKTFAHQPRSSIFLFENSLLGRLTASDGLVHSVDDLAIPAPQAVFPWMWQQGQIPVKVKQFVVGNSLQAFELDTGKFRWRLGSDPDNDRREEDGFGDSHFLGSPLTVGDRLHVLNEKNSGDSNEKGKKGANGEAELRLVCINPKKLAGQFRPKVIAPILSLGKIPEHLRITHNPDRRISSVELVHSGGILICPTNAGKVIGVDLKKMISLWTYAYKEMKKDIPIRDPLRGPFVDGPINFNREWRAPGTFLHKDRLIFAAPDEGSVHCIAVKDGKPIWKSPRKDGLYVAGVFGDKVLVVGPKTCWTLGVDDGKVKKWHINTGVPCGQGTAQGNIYYLPLRKSAATGKPGIALIDIARGKILETVDSVDGELLGNLLIHQDMLISQSATHMAAFPFKTAKR